MRNKMKKLLSFVAAATMLTSTLVATACGGVPGGSSTGTKLEGYVSGATVASNGGFAVEKGDYVYFINGAEAYTADNTYGNVVKGALMRIKKADLATNPAAAEVVVPTLVGSQNFNAGIFIYGDYVYYATPTKDKNIQGVVENSWIDFKRAKLDGSEIMNGYYFRLGANTTTFRFVEEGDTVYCLYEEGGALKSFNTKTGKDTVLVKGAGTYFYDKKDLTNGDVYYTMNVSYDLDSDKSTVATYNQIYKVNAAATATVNASEASYTVAGGRTYDFDKAWLEKKNDEAKKAADSSGTDYEAKYVFDDYTTYPYVNLGTLVLDGIGSACEELTQFNDVTNFADVQASAGELQGYKYTIQRYENGGVYYTRSEVASNKRLYYLSETTMADTSVNTVAANGESDVVALNTSKASSSALFEIVNDAHRYIYVSGNNIYRATAAADGSIEEDVKLCGNASGKTLWKTEGEYLYYYGSGESTSGNLLYRINYNGAEAKYDTILNLDETAEYRPASLDYVDFASSWYKPEIFGDTLLYANAKSIGNSSYNYVYATKFGTADEIKASNEAYEAASKYIEEEFTSDLKNAATYLFRTFKDGERKAGNWFYDDFAAVQTEYEADKGKPISWVEDLEEYWDDVEAGTCLVESDFIKMIGAYSENDTESIREAWQGYLPFPEEEEVEEEGWPWWALTLVITIPTFVAVGGAIALIVYIRAKQRKKAEAEATVNAYKRPKIDTTDDKSIDVYADETPASENE